MQVSEPTHGPEDRTKKLFPYLSCQVFAVSDIRQTCVRKRVRPCAPRSIQKTLMTLGAVPGCVIRASNYPLGAKIWSLQQNTPDFAQIDETDFGEVLIGITSSQDPFVNKYFDAFAPPLVPNLIEAVLSHYCQMATISASTLPPRLKRGGAEWQTSAPQKNQEGWDRSVVLFRAFRLTLASFSSFTPNPAATSSWQGAGHEEIR